MSARVEKLCKEIENLTSEELRELLNRMADRIELLGWLKLSEPTFSDWDNPEDAAYDRIEERLKEGYLALAESHKTDAEFFLPAQAEVLRNRG